MVIGLYEHELQSHPDAADLRVESSGAEYDEYEDQSHDHSDDHADGEGYAEDPNPRPRGRFIFVAAVFGLALLGTAGAFAYRALFADSIVPSLLSIIKAEGGPNKIIPTSTASQGSVFRQADADNAGSSERLVRREERPVDVPPPVSTAPHPVSTAPIFPDSAPAAEPGAASVFPPTPLAQPAPAARVDSLKRAAPAPPIPSANQAAAPAAPTLTPVSAQQQGAKPSDANEPLSIVPSSNDATTAAGSARTAPPARPANRLQPKLLLHRLPHPAEATRFRSHHNATKRRCSHPSASSKPNIPTCSVGVSRWCAALIWVERASITAPWWVRSFPRNRPMNCVQT